MKSLLALCFIVLIGFSTPMYANDTPNFGVGRLFTNDFLGDGHDRWRSGSYSLSIYRSELGPFRLPKKPWELIEYRFRSEIIAPANMRAVGQEDRPYAGVLSFGVHTHFLKANTEYALGVDLVAVGPQTGLLAFQDYVHNALGLEKIDRQIVQIPNNIYPTITIELARSINLSERVLIRPFMEFQAGVEKYARAGFDLMLGASEKHSVRSRDVATGHRYRPNGGRKREGVSIILGADIARVFNSHYLPAELGYEFTRKRVRTRFGVQVQGKRAGLFYGLTWLSKEFRGQSSGQVVGSVQFAMEF